MDRHHTIPLAKIENELTLKHQVSVALKREDLIHDVISGNKWWKLKFNIAHAKTLNKEYLLTFGGAYSNHIIATAAAGYENDVKTIGIIRGEKVQPLNPTLREASERFGMQLHFISRTAYREKNHVDVLTALQIPIDVVSVLPEGGTNSLAVKGCQEILNGIPPTTDFVCCSCGTGGTMAGLISGLQGKQFVLGFSALKGDFLQNEVAKLVKDTVQQSYNNWIINTAYHFGGYAKHNKQLISFINNFKKSHHISLDPIYTGKMMYGIFDLIAQGYFPKNSKIVAIHSGGLQGISGFNERFGNILE